MFSGLLPLATKLRQGNILYVSVILFIGGGGCQGYPQTDTPQTETPLDRDPPDRDPNTVIGRQYASILECIRVLNWIVYILNVLFILSTIDQMYVIILTLNHTEKTKTYKIKTKALIVNKIKSN